MTKCIRSMFAVQCWLFGIFCFLTTVLCPLIARSETYVLPARADLGFAMPTVSLPLAEYTNCVAYYTAAAPVFGEGTADYLIPDLSPARNDATQPGTGYQPTRIYTDGEWALSFDGVDDTVVFAGVSGPTWDVEIQLSVPADPPSGIAWSLFSRTDGSNLSSSDFVLDYYRTVRAFFYYAGGYNMLAADAGDTTTIRYACYQTYQRLWLDGSLAASKSVSDQPYSRTDKCYLGSREGLKPGKYSISTVKVSQ